MCAASSPSSRCRPRRELPRADRGRRRARPTAAPTPPPPRRSASAEPARGPRGRSAAATSEPEPPRAASRMQRALAGEVVGGSSPSPTPAGGGTWRSRARADDGAKGVGGAPGRGRARARRARRWCAAGAAEKRDARRQEPKPSAPRPRRGGDYPACSRPRGTRARAARVRPDEPARRGERRLVGLARADVREVLAIIHWPPARRDVPARPKRARATVVRRSPRSRPLRRSPRPVRRPPRPQRRAIATTTAAIATATTTAATGTTTARSLR